MSQRCKELTVSEELFRKFSDRITVEPDNSVFSGGMNKKFHMDLSKDAGLLRAQSSCLLFAGYEPYITKGLRNLINQYKLFAFAYAFNNENHSKHIRVVITSARQIKLCWVRDTNPLWPYLELYDWNDCDIVGMIDIENHGYYTPYVMGKDVLGTKYECSQFDFRDRVGYVTVVYNKSKSAFTDVPEMPFEIVQPEGMHLLEKELRRFIVDFEATD